MKSLLFISSKKWNLAWLILFLIFIGICLTLSIKLTLITLIILVAVYEVIRNTRIGIYLILIIPIFGQIARFNIAGLGGGVLLLDLVVLFVLGVFLFKRWYYKKSLYKIFKQPVFNVFILFLILALLSLFWGAFWFSLPFKDFIKSFLYWGRLGLYFSVMLMSYDLFKTSQNKLKLIYFMVGCGVLIAILGFLQLRFYGNFLELKLYEQGWDPHINRLTSTWLDPNFVGGFFVINLLMAISFLLFEYQKKKKQFLSISFLMGAIFIISFALFYTFSRSSYLSLLVGGGVLGLIKARKTLFVSVVLGLIIFSFSSRLQMRVDNAIMSFRALFFESTLSLDPTAKLRVESWQKGLNIWSKNPVLGVGYNTLRYVNLHKGYAEFDKHSASGFDSSLLTVLATTGILGMGCYLWWLWLILKQLLFKFKNGFYFYLSLGLLSSFLALFIHSFFVNSFFFPFIIVPWFILLGIVFIENTDKKNVK